MPNLHPGITHQITLKAIPTVLFAAIAIFIVVVFTLIKIKAVTSVFSQFSSSSEKHFHLPAAISLILLN